MAIRPTTPDDLELDDRPIVTYHATAPAGESDPAKMLGLVLWLMLFAAGVIVVGLVDPDLFRLAVVVAVLGYAVLVLKVGAK